MPDLFRHPARRSRLYSLYKSRTPAFAGVARFGDDMMPTLKPITSFDPHAVRTQFPALAGKELSYLDSAASAQKPKAVIDAMTSVLQNHYANVHRGVYRYAEKTTGMFEAARGKVARFIGAEEREIVFTRNTTEAINLAASSWGRAFLKEGDEILLTTLEHHANIVPWQMLAKEKGLAVKFSPVGKNGGFDFEAWKALLTPKTKLAAFAHMSNVTGAILPVAEMTALAKKTGAVTLVDGSQAVVHLPVDVRDLGCDFYAFTGHKLYGPTGIGVLCGRHDLLEKMPPYQGGGEMIETVTTEGVTFKPPPTRFEAGTPAFVEAIGLGAAIDWLAGFDRKAVMDHEDAMLRYAEEKLAAMDGLHMWGNPKFRAGLLSFTMKGAHPHDVATILDQAGVAVRAGHHCAQPLMKALGVPATVRLSVGIYTLKEDIDRLIDGLLKARKLFG